MDELEHVFEAPLSLAQDQGVGAPGGPRPPGSPGMVLVACPGMRGRGVGRLARLCSVTLCKVPQRRLRGGLGPKSGS